MDIDIIFWKILFIFSAFYWSVVVSRLIVKNRGLAAIKSPDVSEEMVRHDYVFNFVAALLGWIALYYFVFLRLIPEYSKFTPKLTLTITDVLILTVAFVGIMGYLPHLIVNKGFRP